MFEPLLVLPYTRVELLLGKDWFADLYRYTAFDREYVTPAFEPAMR